MTTNGARHKHGETPRRGEDGRLNGHGRRATKAAAAALGAALALAAPVHGQDGGERGPVTNLPLPRFVSLKASEGNARRGPSLSHRIDWVFKRRDMPLQITGEYGHWRRVQDRDGAGGWMHYALLSGARTVIVTESMTPLRRHPQPEAQVLAEAEADVVAELDECVPDWCRIEAGGARGWARREALWGVGPGEEVD